MVSLLSPWLCSTHTHTPVYNQLIAALTLLTCLSSAHQPGGTSAPAFQRSSARSLFLATSGSIVEYSLRLSSCLCNSSFLSDLIPCFYSCQTLALLCFRATPPPVCLLLTHYQREQPIWVLSSCIMLLPLFVLRHPLEFDWWSIQILRSLPV